MPLGFYMTPLIMVGAGVYLLYRCFLPQFFRTPDYLYSRRYTEEDRERERIAGNRRGRILTAAALLLGLWLTIPYAKDMFCMANGNYSYAVVAYYDEDTSILYPEYIYDAETDSVSYDADAAPYERTYIDLRLGKMDPEEGTLWLVRYLPNTKYGEILGEVERRDT